MKKPIIALDIDEVLFPFVQEFLRYHNDRYGTELLLDNFVSYRFEDIIFGIDETEAIRRVKDFGYVPHGLVEPVKEAQLGVQKLQKKHRLVLVTARHPELRENTQSWLNHYFPGAFEDVIMLGYEHDPSAIPKTKSQVCQEISAIALVDDSPRHVFHAIESGIEGVLFGNYPWNQLDTAPEGLIKVEGWTELAEYFDARV